MRKIIIAVLAIILVAPVFGQKVQEAKITYEFKMTGEGVEQMEAFMPTSMEVAAGKSGSMVKINGGMLGSMMGAVVAIKSGTYMIKHDEQTIYEMEDDKEDEEEVKPVVEKLEEVIEILGYKCQKYKVTTPGAAGDVVTFVWVTEDIQFPKVKGMSQGVQFAGLPGIALKTMASQMGITTVLTATEISTDKLDKDLFKLPKGYEMKKFDPSVFGGGF